VTDLSDNNSPLENDSTIVPLTRTPAIALVKVGTFVDNAPTGVNVGDQITYAFTVTNTGNVPLSNITITDPLPGIVLSGGPLASLAPGVSNSTTFTGLYTITQADINAGRVANQALATGTPPVGPPVTDLSDNNSPLENDSTIVPLTPTPSIALVKSGTFVDNAPIMSVNVGDQILYSFTVTNTGNVPLSNITITDPLPGLVLSGGPLASLAPGASNGTTFTGLYTITQADITAGRVANQALATGTPPVGPPVTDLSDNNSPLENDSTIIPITREPSIALVKRASVSGPRIVGATINYTFVATNTGNVPLTNVRVTDPLPGLSAISPTSVANLAPGSSTTFTATYVITPADVQAGRVTNQGLATGTSPMGSNVTDISDTGTDPEGAPIQTPELVDSNGDGNPNNDPTVLNLPPLNRTFAIDDINNTFVNTPVNGNVLTNDFDPEGNTIILTLTPVSGPTNGTVTLSANGNYVYTPTTGFVGEDSFRYRICDTGIPQACDTARVVISVLPLPVGTANNPPVAVNDNYQGKVNTPVVGTVLPNDSDPDGNLNPSSVTLVSGPSSGTLVLNPNGTFTYTPTTNFVGDVVFRYQVCDTGMPVLCDQADVTIKVYPSELRTNFTFAVDDSYLGPQFQPITGNVLNNDFDPEGNVQTPSLVSGPTNGTLVLNPNGTFTYNATSGFTGPDRFVYRVCDNGTPVACDTATVYLLTYPVKVQLLPKAYLQGSLFGVFLPDSLMRDNLRTKNLIPTTSPYPAMGMTGITPVGAASVAVVGSSTLSNRNSIVDWVFVELRSATNPTLVVDSRSALIQRDGDIVEVDGVSPVVFNSAVPASYYVVVKHRNHLGVMTASPIALGFVPAVVDFRRPTTPTFNLDPLTPANIAQVPVQQGVAMWAGNALNINTSDQRREVIFQGSDNDVNVIFQQVISAPSNALFGSPFFKLGGYFTGDVNMDGEVIFQGTGNDAEFIFQNVIKNHAGNTLSQPFFKIREQLP
jgi:uncharacterized repeat protein (TIGR01451 family)